MATPDDVTPDAPQAGVWAVDRAEGVATGPTTPVGAGGRVAAVITALWSDTEGVRLSFDWQDIPDDMSAAEALELAEVLRSVASIDGPQV